MQILSRTSLKDKFTRRAQKRNVREVRDSIAKLRARPPSAVVNGFPEDPVLHQIVRDENGVFWKRNQADNDWEQFIDESSEEFTIPIVDALPLIPTEKARLVWFEGQLWGSAAGASRWYPTMRYTTTTGVP